MKRRIAIYCPDRHLAYDGATPDNQGVGGGVTARIRLAAGLARLGHEVSVICNTAKRAVVGGVRYLPLDAAAVIDADVLILHSTGDRLDLSPILSVKVDARRRVVFVDGIDAPKGLTEVGMDYLCAPSNFIRGIAVDRWGVPAGKVFVSLHGVERRLFQAAARGGWLSAPQRKPHRIAYATHPSKGLEAAAGVLRMLRARDPRFELHVFGGFGLWGGADKAGYAEPGMVYHGLVGQKALARELAHCAFALYLQTRLEPFGIAIAEAMAAGCVTLASAVGAHPEIVSHGRSGFLLEGDPAAVETQRQAADIISAVANAPAFGDMVREAGRVAPLDWDRIALTWEQYWSWLDAGRTGLPALGECVACREPWLVLADGFHCRSCGRYSRSSL